MTGTIRCCSSCSKGYRVIAHDRRGHGRSTQTATGNDMDTYAADVAELAAALDLQGRDPCRPFHRRRRGRALRCAPRQGAGRQGRADRRRPAGHGEVATRTRAARRSKCSTACGRRLPPTARSSTSTCPSGPFYGFNRPGAKVSRGPHPELVAPGHDGRRATRTTTASRCSRRPTSPRTSKQIDVPVLVMHGDDDQIVPIADSALLAIKLVEERHAQGLCGPRPRHVRTHPRSSIRICSPSFANGGSA